MDRTTFTWGEVLERVLQRGVPWQVMDDDQKASFAKACKKWIGKTTADGVRLTWDRFGEAVMASGGAVSHYFRRSEGQKSPPSADSTVRSMKSLIRKDPAVVDELLKDKQIRQAVTDSMMTPERHQLKQAPTRGFTAAGCIARIRNTFPELIEAVREGDQPADLQDFVAEVIDWTEELRGAERGHTGSGPAAGADVVSIGR